MVDRIPCWPSGWVDCQPALQQAAAGNRVVISPSTQKPGGYDFYDADENLLGYSTKASRLARTLEGGKRVLGAEVFLVDKSDDLAKVGVDVYVGDEGEDFVSERRSSSANEALVLHLPPSYPSDLIARGAPLEACPAFYVAADLGGLTDEQAGALLDYRDFARAIVERQSPTLRFVESRPFAEAVAIYISRHRAMAEGVVAMIRKRFNSGADRDGLKRAVSRFEYFDEIDAFCEDLEPGR